MEVQDMMFNIANAVRNELIDQLEANGNVDTGMLKNSINVTFEGTTLIITTNETGKFIEFGTAPHKIRPRNKKALRFKVGGKWVYATEVNHPGTEPSPFVRPVIHQKLNQIVNKYYVEQ